MKNKFNLDMTHVSKEFRLIVDIIKSDQTFIIKDGTVDINWEKFLDLAVHHRVFPQLYTKLKKSPGVPKDIIYKLKYLYKKNTFNMLHLSGEMGEIAKLFLDQQIRILFLKGPMLADDLYGDISLRTSGDLDVLIPIEELANADKLLEDRGYVKDDYILSVLNDWKWRHHHVTYFQPEKKVKVEIHWRLSPGPGVEPTFDDLWKRKRLSAMASHIHLLGKEDLFLFLVTHGARHGWSRLRWLVDIHQLVKQQIDYDQLRKLSKKYQCLHLIGQALVLASQMFDTPISNKSAKLMAGKRSFKLAQKTTFYFERMINLHSEPLPEGVSNYHSRYLFASKTVAQKSLFIMSFLYPYPEDADMLPLPKVLHFLYFPLRPALWFWRKTRRHALP